MTALPLLILAAAASLTIWFVGRVIRRELSAMKDDEAAMAAKRVLEIERWRSGQ